ncbi:amidophosphoribosyltransferase [Candidatus Peregrinibacteria bacterium]|nr:amidophosphoribosyltransferase [Candidatus Peregrinibacteria bacterium]
MCGIVGIYGYDYAAQDIYDGLVTLQHRGQDAAGIATYDGKFHIRKDFGLVRDVFHTRHMQRLLGYAGLGHTRYATIGTGDAGEIQPFIGPAPYGVVLVHNGNLHNSHELKQEIFEKDHRLINSDSDGEVLLNMFTKALTKQNADGLKPQHIWKAVESVYKRAKGGYSVIAYIAKQGMVAFRDPHGIRPMVFGKRKVGLNTEYMIASESVALDILGFELIDDVANGEAIFIEEKTRKVFRKKISQKKFAPCVFEYVYFARPDSLMNKISVYKARLRMGKKLAKKIKKLNLDIDAVMPVPDSSRTAAFAIADELGLHYREGLIKNRYIGRTFIMPGQKIRKKSIRYKLNPMPLEIEGKNILLIDDSIVRGNTSRKIVEMVRATGAKKVYFASYSPPIISPNIYGIDIATREELIAHNASVEDVRKFIGADALIYGDLKDMFDSCVEGNPKIKDLDMSCFDGRYVTGDVTEELLEKQATSRCAEREVSDEDEPVAEDQLNLL